MQKWYNTVAIFLPAFNGIGALYSGWIIIQILLIQTIYFLHYVMGAAGLALVTTGWLWLESNKQVWVAPSNQ